MQSKLTASIGDMERFQSLYALKDAGNQRHRQRAAVERRAERACEQDGADLQPRVRPGCGGDGGDDYLRAVEQMADMSVEDAQRIIDSYQDLSLAQKQQELDQRSLYVNSLKDTTFETPKQRMVAFRETCLDVKEAIYSDSGLSAAFAKAGASVEGFAAELMAMDTTMADFASGLTDYTSQVSNGFSQFTKYGKTGLAEWEETLNSTWPRARPGRQIRSGLREGAGKHRQRGLPQGGHGGRLRAVGPGNRGHGREVVRGNRALHQPLQPVHRAGERGRHQRVQGAFAGRGNG